MLAKSDQELLRSARDQILDVPDVPVTLGTLATPLAQLSQLALPDDDFRWSQGDKRESNQWGAIANRL
jgi:hypothetical protein